MAKISTPRDLFVNALNEMLYVEQKQAETALPELAKQTQNPQLKQGFQHHLEETKQQIANLERIFELLGEEAKPDKSHIVDGLIAQHEKVVKNIESPELVDLFNASAASKAEHLEISAYRSLIMMAESMGESEVVQLLEENFDQEQHTAQEIETMSTQLLKETAPA